MKKNESKIIPAMLCLNAAMSIGGKVLTPMLIAKKVVPQKMETAVKASQAKNLGDRVKLLI